MGSKPPQTRKGTQSFPFQSLPHEPETAWIKSLFGKKIQIFLRII